MHLGHDIASHGIHENGVDQHRRSGADRRIGDKGTAVPGDRQIPRQFQVCERPATARFRRESRAFFKLSQAAADNAPHLADRLMMIESPEGELRGQVAGLLGQA